MDARGQTLLSNWLTSLSEERRASLYLLLDEICSGLDVSRHNRFGFLRLRAEFETSGELFGCTLEELRAAFAASLGDRIPRPGRQASALEELRDRVASRGHPDFR
jgi:ABC-type hemin transport system ATPase subunit